MTKVISLDEIFALRPERKEVDFGEMGVLYVQAAAENRDAYEYLMAEITPTGAVTMSMENHRAKTVVAFTVDENGQRLFRNDQVEEVSKRPVWFIDKLFEASQEMMGSMPSVEDAKEP
ncbi:hypothetical protein [Ferrimonas balearica]|uniref:hypothetical protein n=1 Tax=Ferrimonas balearica TaxID=44012 RepID=UPI001C9A16CF|nr:hypothetical protein [Ferrimonas balearica]MBY5992515.1 hypothetical protein [Ferrimonas balearica]